MNGALEPLNNQGGKDLRAIALMGILCCCVLLAYVFLFSGFTIDDAFISFRYSANFAAGNGLVFNIGERVEGYSNFLWVLILGFLGKMGMDIVEAAKVLGLLSLVAVIAAVYKLVRAATGDAICAMGSLLVVVTSFGLTFYALTGMETVFFTALLTWGGYVFYRNNARVSVGLMMIATAAALTRPEGVLFFPILIAFELARHKRVSKRLVGNAVAFTLMYASYLVWRYSYYGYLLPNTYYAKPPTISSRLPPVVSGFDDIYRFVTATGGPILLACLVYMATSRQVRKKLYPLIPVPVLVVVFQFYSGGDWMESYRYLVPIIPSYIAICVCGMWWILTKATAAKKRRLIMTGLSIVAVFNLAESANFYFKRDSYPNFVMTSEDLIPAAKWVGNHYPASYTIVCWRIGALAYYSKLNLTDDGWGLTDEFVAHSKKEGEWNEAVREEYLAERNPELIMTGSNRDACLEDEIVAGGRTYDLVRHFRQGRSGWWVLYEREDLTASPR
jgi:hypothetical protein